MFSTAELGRKVSKADFETEVVDLRARLVQLQYRFRHADFPVILVIAGNDSLGRHDAMNVVHEWMDPRFLDTHGFGHPTDEEQARPRFWRYWRVLPANGRIGVFYGSWNRRPVFDRIDRKIDKREFDKQIDEIISFERMLADDGALLLKFWLHLSRKKLKKRLKAAKKDPDLAWRINERDWDLLDQYDRVTRIHQRFVRRTNTPTAPWLIVESTNARYRNLTIGRTLLESIAQRVEHSANGHGCANGTAIALSTPDDAAEGGRRSVLDTLDLSQKLEPDEYKEKLDKLQGRIHTLGLKAFHKGLASVLVFEGWDAAGKGGTIRRLTVALDPRDYSMISISAPTQEELAHHYLWRFWRELPPNGKMRIFDRSWYGRVLVERVEGFAREDEWMRAYREINEFEESLVDHGMLLMKFWLHIDREEQLRRFRAREATAFKQHKIGPEDWRNRGKWDEYEQAVNAMIQRTSTDFAPWNLIEANDKRHARIKVLNLVADAFADRLGES